MNVRRGSFARPERAWPAADPASTHAAGLAWTLGTIQRTVGLVEPFVGSALIRPHTAEMDRVDAPVTLASQTAMAV